MTSSNRLQFAFGREATPGTAASRMRRARFTSESLQYKPIFVNSDEIRPDRMNSDPIKVNETNDGSVEFEFSYPHPDSFLSDGIRSALFNDWVQTPSRDNDGTADSIIQGVAATGQVVTVSTGAAFAAGQLVRFSGFTNASNNGTFKVTTASATVPAFTGAGLVDETAPPANARMKVVGVEGASADITAVADGLGSTALNWTTLGLTVGQWVKIGGTAVGNRFATAANNGWARIIAIAATKLTLDNLPSGWATDTGTGKTIRVWYGDTIRNGTTMTALSLERGFMGQTVPSYIDQLGMVVDKYDLAMPTEGKVTGSFSFMGLTGSAGTTPISANPDPATTAAIMASNVNVGRIAESGAVLSAPNYVKSAKFSTMNNLRAKTAVGTVGAIEISSGEFEATAELETYFGDLTLYSKLLAGTPGNINTRAGKNSQFVIIALPRVTFTEGNPNAGGNNQDVTLPLKATASMDTLTSSMIIIDRFEYAES